MYFYVKTFNDDKKWMKYIVNMFIGPLVEPCILTSDLSSSIYCFVSTLLLSD
jgi:hypothetical protein